MQHIIDQFAETIRAAAQDTTKPRTLLIRGGGTKDFYGNRDTGSLDSVTLDARAYSGIVDYEPTELVIKARSGTPLVDLEAQLVRRGQMLAFEPPHFGTGATLGGCIATGLSGPRRASAGAARDFVLGVRMLNGRGEDLAFGGQVMKNVAGYDVSRLMTGSMGTLGLLLEVSLKVLPLPASELTLRLSMSEAAAIEKMNAWGRSPLPISATCFCDGELNVRLSGAESAVRAACNVVGGEEIPQGAAFWESVREQTHPFFRPRSSFRLWRLSIKSTAAPLSLPGRQLIEWGGALRWLIIDRDSEAGHGQEASMEDLVRNAAKKAGGHATLFRSDKPSMAVFHPLSPAMMAVSQRLKEKFDPMHLFNPGRMYPEI